MSAIILSWKISTLQLFSCCMLFHCTRHYVLFQVVIVITKPSSGFNIICLQIFGFHCLEEGRCELDNGYVQVCMGNMSKAIQHCPVRALNHRTANIFSNWLNRHQLSVVLVDLNRGWHRNCVQMLSCFFGGWMNIRSVPHLLLLKSENCVFPVSLWFSISIFNSLSVLLKDIIHLIIIDLLSFRTVPSCSSCRLCEEIWSRTTLCNHWVWNPVQSGDVSRSEDNPVAGDKLGSIQIVVARC